MSKLALDLSVCDCLEAGIDTKLISQAVSNDDAFILDMHDNSTPLSSVPVEYKEFSAALDTHREMLNIQTNPDFRPNSDIAASKNYWNLVWRFIRDTASFEDTTNIFLRVFITGKSRLKLLKLMPKSFIRVDVSGVGRSKGFTSDTGREKRNVRHSPKRDEGEMFKADYRHVVKKEVQQFGKLNGKTRRKHTNTLIEFLKQGDPNIDLKTDALAEHFAKTNGYFHLSTWGQFKKFSQEVFREFPHGQSFISAANNNNKPAQD